MKNLVSQILIIVLFVSCVSTSKTVLVVDDTDYQLKRAFSQAWMGGAPGSGSGVELFIPTHLLDDPVDVETVYYNNMVSTSAKYTDISRAMVVVHFKKAEKVMSLNSNEEYANAVPALAPEFQKLKENQALVFYSQRGKQHKKLIKNIQLKSPQTYPSMPSE
ncbi:MAG: hypothetical protein WBG46_11180 [Nonlabens sp.]